jgi:4-amino-4-deoxy-L-arabinose transferase-like glycosyltransferase
LQAAYLVNALYQAITLMLVPLVIAPLVERREGRPLAWILQLLPIAFTYRIRANHEQAVLACLLVALYALERARTRPPWILAAAAALAALMLVKGLLVVPALLVCAAWWLIRRPVGSAALSLRAGLGMILILSGLLAVALLYDGSYARVTGQSFLPTYLQRQIAPATLGPSGAVLAHKSYNVFWYTARVVWFAFPWSVFALAALWSVRGGLRPASGEDVETADGRTRQGLLMTLAVVAVYVGLFSLSDRKADRYIFPAYYAAGICGAVAALRWWPRLQRLVSGLDGPWAAPAVWLATFALHLAGGRLHLPRIKVWTS